MPSAAVLREQAFQLGVGSGVGSQNSFCAGEGEV